jgi:hypothetical protein
MGRRFSFPERERTSSTVMAGTAWKLMLLLIAICESGTVAVGYIRDSLRPSSTPSYSLKKGSHSHCSTTAYTALENRDVPSLVPSTERALHRLLFHWLRVVRHSTLLALTRYVEVF